MFYSYTVVIRNLYSYLHVVIPSIYTTIGGHYPQFSLSSLMRARSATSLVSFLYRLQLLNNLCFFDSWDLTQVPGSGPKEQSYPLRGVVHNALPKRLLHRSTTTRGELNQRT